MDSHVREIESILAAPTGERAIHGYLKRHPALVADTFCSPRSTARVVSEFSLGDEYRADFLAGVPMSGGWFLYLIELKPPNADLFTAKAVPAEHLNAALSQHRAWKIFEEKNRAYLIQQIARAFRERDLYIPDRQDPEPYCNAGTKMTDENCMILIQHKIMIGRRDQLTPREIGLKAAFSKTDDIDVHTYDHLISMSRHFRNNT